MLLSRDQSHIGDYEKEDLRSKRRNWRKFPTNLCGILFKNGALAMLCYRNRYTHEFNEFIDLSMMDSNRLLSVYARSEATGRSHIS